MYGMYNVVPGSLLVTVPHALQDDTTRMTGMTGMTVWARDRIHEWSYGQVCSK
jgi:hypothetical protein